MASDFDKPIGLYDLLDNLEANSPDLTVSFEILRFYVPFGDIELKVYLAELSAWGWITTDESYNVTAITRPTEHIYLRPRPVQEVRS